MGQTRDACPMVQGRSGTCCAHDSRPDPALRWWPQPRSWPSPQGSPWPIPSRKATTPAAVSSPPSPARSRPAAPSPSRVTSAAPRSSSCRAPMPRPPRTRRPTGPSPRARIRSASCSPTLGPGDITVVAVVPESECGDTDHVTVTAAVPNTATEAPSDVFTAITGLFLLGTALAFRRARMEVRRSRR